MNTTPDTYLVVPGVKLSGFMTDVAPEHLIVGKDKFPNNTEDQALLVDLVEIVDVKIAVVDVVEESVLAVVVVALDEEIVPGVAVVDKVGQA
ncbi:hypothetical protein PI124_g16430 [Phytophthora idaei]|nr:hypothetical protein PI124_g16430 [Phytophthora idaei]